MIERWKEWWSRLTKRERLLVSGGIGLISVILLFIVVVEPQLDQLTRLERTITRHHTTLRELTPLGQEYQRLQHQLTELDARIQAGHGSFSLLPFLEELAERKSHRASGIHRIFPRSRSVTVVSACPPIKCYSG